MRKLTPDGKCSIPGCERNHLSKTYCQLHLRRWQRGLDMNAPVAVQSNKGQDCSYELCNRPMQSRGYCNVHRNQVRAGQTPRPIRVIEKYESDADRIQKCSRYDPVFGCWLWNKPNSIGYGTFTADGKPFLAHRWSYEIHKGAIPSGHEIDHQCRNRSCINPGHLRAVTRKENMENLGLHALNTSGYRGVSQVRGGNWRAHVVHHGKQYNKGGFSTPEDANEWVVAKRLELYGNNVKDRKETE